MKTNMSDEEKEEGIDVGETTEPSDEEVDADDVDDDEGTSDEEVL